MPARRRREWFDDDSFWRALYPFMFPEARFAAAREDVTKVLALTRPKGKAVLDLCCGPGRFTVPLAKRGFKVTGVDRTKFLLDKARARARAVKAKVEWIRQDMRDFVRSDAFDLVLSMFTSFGYFDDKREDLQVLTNIFMSLKPGGSVLFQLGGKEWLAKIFTPTSSHRLEDGTLLVQRHEIFDDWTRIRNEWILIRGGRAKTFRFHHTVYSAQELRERMEHAGFVDVKVYGGLEGGEYAPGSPGHMVVVGRKPGRGRAPGRRPRPRATKASLDARRRRR
jgi:SAM-dependent methyltransferase